MAATEASMVVNGSYYSRAATPDTPVVSDGHRLGPASYQATHGAFVAGGPGGPYGARLVDGRLQLLWPLVDFRRSGLPMALVAVPR